jgi:hypothetical protein
MPKPPSPHPYANLAAFERLLVLLATFVRYPGVGNLNQDSAPNQMHDALQEVQYYVQKVAQELGVALPHYSTYTLRKDLVTLRRYGVLDQRMYRWGYYLGTGAMSLAELRVVIQAARSQAQAQGDPQTRQVCRVVEKRLRGLDLELQGQLFYPVRSQLNRTIVYSDPEEMMQQGQYRHTLFHCLEALETAIVQGEPIKLHRRTDPFGTIGVGSIQVYPLQLIYADIAWYLLYEYIENQHLEIERVDRFNDDCQILQVEHRGIAVQEQRLQIAQKLLQNGWGLYLGTPEQQKLEQSGMSTTINVQVRFFAPVDAFILEGDRRHSTQKLRKGCQNKQTYVDYSVQLPERSLGEFSRWVNRFMHHAKILTPTALAAQHQENALKLAQLYS